MDHKDQRFAEEVLRRALAHAKSLVDEGRRGNFSSTVLPESEIRAATNRNTRLEQSVIDSYVAYFVSMGGSVCLSPQRRCHLTRGRRLQNQMA